MNNIEILKRLYRDYTKKFLNKIFLAVFFSILVAGSTSATAWLLDPAIEKIFINKDQTLILVIPFFIIVAFATKGISLYFAKVIMIIVSEEVKKNIQTDMLSSFIKADTELIENNIKPKSIFKEINSNIAQIYDIDYHEENLQKDIDIPPHKIGQEITKLRKEMKNMSKEMRFEEAARLRDKIKKLRKVELSLIGEIE